MDSKDRAWFARLKELNRFRLDHGRWPSKEPGVSDRERKLAVWHDHAKDLLEGKGTWRRTNDRIEALRAFGVKPRKKYPGCKYPEKLMFDRDKDWCHNLKHLVEFRQNHARWPSQSGDAEEKRLAIWRAHQIAAARGRDTTRFDPIRQELLVSLGVVDELVVAA